MVHIERSGPIDCESNITLGVTVIEHKHVCAWCKGFHALQPGSLLNTSTLYSSPILTFLSLCVNRVVSKLTVKILQIGHVNGLNTINTIEPK